MSTSSTGAEAAWPGPVLLLINPVQVGERELPPCNTGLVRHDHGHEALVREQPHPDARAREQLELLDRRHGLRTVDVEDAVTVEEHDAAHPVVRRRHGATLRSDRGRAEGTS